jgi:hypothetical protein
MCKKKKLVSVLLTAGLLLSLMPLSVMATDSPDSAGVADSVVAGSQSPSVDNSATGSQSPSVDNSATGSQSPSVDNSATGSQSPSVDNSATGSQSPSVDNSATGTTTTKPSTGTTTTTTTTASSTGTTTGTGTSTAAAAGTSSTSDTATTAAVNAVNNVLGNALKDSSADAAKVLSTLTTQVTKEQLQIAMQSDATALQNVKTLEDKYAKEQNITVAEPTVSAEAKEQVKGTITVVGAALNADANETVQLSLAVPSTLEEINTNLYKNSVQLDLSLFVGGAAKSELDVPVTITMPIPAGVEKDNLVILHYHDGNAPETLATSVNGDTVTFTVTGFSTFVFANTVNTATTAPKTSDTGIWMFLIALVAGMGVVAYGVYRFRKVR